MEWYNLWMFVLENGCRPLYNADYPSASEELDDGERVIALYRLKGVSVYDAIFIDSDREWAELTEKSESILGLLAAPYDFILP